MQYCKSCGIHRIADAETFCIECSPPRMARGRKIAEKHGGKAIKAAGLLSMAAVLAGAVLHHGRK